MKFLFKISKSLSVFISGTFVVKSPSPIAVDAEIRLFIDLKNLEENLIATEIDTNSKTLTTIIYIIYFSGYIYYCNCQQPANILLAAPIGNKKYQTGLVSIGKVYI